MQNFVCCSLLFRQWATFAWAVSELWQRQEQQLEQQIEQVALWAIPTHQVNHRQGQVGKWGVLPPQLAVLPQVQVQQAESPWECLQLWMPSTASCAHPQKWHESIHTKKEVGLVWRLIQP